MASGNGVRRVELEQSVSEKFLGVQADRRKFFGSATLAAVSGAAWAKFAYGQAGNEPELLALVSRSWCDFETACR